MLEHDDLSRFLDLLGNRNRRRILDLLHQKPCYVTEIADRLILSPKVVIEHLALLEREALIGFNLDERRRKYYYLYQELDVSIAVRMTSTQRPRAPPPGRTARMLHHLGQLRQLLDTRDGLLATLDGIDHEIEQRLGDLIKSGEGIIGNETDIDLLLALSGGSPTLEALPDLVGLSSSDVNDRLARLQELGVVRLEGSHYRVRDTDAK